jgi:5-methylcytosine-specific restriction endonuclease McrA
MLWRSQDGRCFYCGADLDPAAMHVDHVRPYAKGGPTRLANLVAACPSCNLRKGAKDVVDLDESRTTPR